MTNGIVLTGRVAWFSNAKGYGFIERTGADDLFVHITELMRCGLSHLRTGQALTFEVGLTPQNRTQAVNVREVPALTAAAA